MKTNKIRTFIKNNLIYLLSFLIPFLIMMFIFIMRKIYPFGDRSFLHVDMYHQYFPFLTEFFHKLKDGESLLYSWDTGIGSNFLALYVYYLSSPLNWLAVLVPEAYLIEFMSYLVILKIGLCGFTFSFYLSRHFKCKNFAIIFFAVFYALSGYMAAYNWNVMWLDCIVLAPLIILGLERLVNEGKCKLYCIALGLSILSNYYISIMICMFLILYFFILLISAADKLKAFIRFAVYSLLAGGMAAVLLIPELEMLLLTEFTNSSFPSTMTAYFPTLDVLARHTMNVGVEIGLEHWPNIYCGVAVFFFLPLYIMSKKIPAKEKFAKVLLLVFFLTSFSYNILDFIWHGFNYPDSLPSRQSFLYIFLLLTLCFEAFLHLREFSKVELARVFFGAAVFLVLCEKLITSEDFTTGAFLITGIILVFYALIIYFYYHKKAAIVWISIAALILVTFEAGINTAVTSAPTVSRTDYLSNYDSYETLTARRRAADPDFFRMEKYKRLTQNDAMLVGYHSASLFSSTSNALVKEFYDKYGMKNSRVFYSFEGATPLTSALLATKYMFSSVEKEPDSLYQLIDKEGDIYLYQNTYSLPLGYIIGTDALNDGKQDDTGLAKNIQDDPQTTDTTTEEANLYDLSELFSSAEDVHSVLQDDGSDNYLESSLNPIEQQNLLASRLSIDTPVFDEIAVTETDTTANVAIEKDSHIYAFVDNRKAATVTVNGGGSTMTFKKLKNAYILDLGWQTAGTTLTLESEEKVPLMLSAYALDEAALDEVVRVLGSQPMVVETYSSTKINGHVTAATPGNLVLSIPYELGWSVKVDGKESTINLFENTMISVPLTEGEHTIEISFYPDSLTIGAIISVISLLLFLALIYLSTRSTAKRGKPVTIPASTAAKEPLQSSK